MEQIIIDNKKCEDLARHIETLLLCRYPSHNITEIENLIQEETYEIARILKQSGEKENVNYDCEIRPVIDPLSFRETYKLIVRRV